MLFERASGRYLYPPQHAMTSIKPASVWLAEDYKQEIGLEFIQYPGDVVFVPETWAHATQNLDVSIGVATE